jgi:hypothetical protein
MRTIQLDDNEFGALHKLLRDVKISECSDDRTAVELYTVFLKVSKTVRAMAAEDGNPDVS